MFQIPFEALKALSPDLYLFIQIVGAIIAIVLFGAGLSFVFQAGLQPEQPGDKKQARLGLKLIACGVFYWATALYTVPILAILLGAVMIVVLAQGLIRAFR